jgi:MFS family permease
MSVEPLDNPRPPQHAEQTDSSTGGAIGAHALVRIASSAEAVLVGLYLAHLGRHYANVPTGLVGSLGAASYAAELLASVPLGIAADIFSVRAVMVAGALTFALAVQLFSLTMSRPLFFASQLLHGIGVAGMTPPLLKYLAQATRGQPTRSARAMSWFELSMLAGLALGGLLGAQLWLHMQGAAFTAVALLGVACALLLRFTVGRMPKQAEAGALGNLSEAMGDPMVRALAPAWLCVNAIIGLWLGPTLVFLLTERPRGGQFLDGLFSATPGEIGYLMLTYAVVFAVGVIAWSRILPRIRLMTALWTSLPAMFAVCLGLFAINHSARWAGALRWSLIAFTALMVMVESGFTPAALSLLARSLEPLRSKGAAMGIYSLLLGLGAMTGSFMAGALGAVWQVDGLLLGTVVLSGLALLLLRRGIRSISGPSPAL